ncbi:virulence-associated V antigen [Aeromonas aquatilis]
MIIRSYRDNIQGFIDDLKKTDLEQLRGSKSSALANLLKLIKEKGILIKELEVGNPPANDAALLEKILAYFLPPDAVLKGGRYDEQITKGIQRLSLLLNNDKFPKNISLKDFLAATYSNLTPDRIDDDVIFAFSDAMSFHEKKRKDLSNEVKELTAELKIYSVIQSHINQKLALNSYWRPGFELMDYKLYGYSSEAAFKEGPEYKLLDKMAPDRKDNSVTAYIFLQSDKKRSGAMQWIKEEYQNKKDNNELSNLATSISDISRPLNDMVTEKTTRLNDVSSRYNSSIEALNRFIQKYESIMSQILQAI